MSTQNQEERRITGIFNDLIEENIEDITSLKRYFEILKQKITKIFDDNLDEIPPEHRCNFADSYSTLVELLGCYQYQSQLLLTKKIPGELAKYIGNVTRKTETFMTLILNKFKIEKDLITL